ncbi:MAG TPA: efflux RND transporter periplasmic adaptor subunit [Anaerolineales bacterium]|nr:efflux RND transporter periplasmic adaptor subunit [Anaerolineales bacterium]
MKKVYWILFSLLALIVAACGQAADPTAIPTVSLDNSSSSSPSAQAGGGNSVSASGVVTPLHEARLSFTTIGRVTSVDVKVGDVVKAGQILVHLDTSIQEARVREAEANLSSAEIQVRYLKRVGTDQVHLESAEADVARAQALVDSAKATLLSQSTLAAPFDGTIVSIDIESAETVTPGKVIIVLGDLSSYRIETTDLSERDVPNVKIGQSASVFIEALNQEFSGKVIDIDRISTTLGGDVVYKVTIGLDDQPQGLLWGMSADVEIKVEN